MIPNQASARLPKAYHALLLANLSAKNKLFYFNFLHTKLSMASYVAMFIYCNTIS